MNKQNIINYIKSSEIDENIKKEIIESLNKDKFSERFFELIISLLNASEPISKILEAISKNL